MTTLIFDCDGVLADTERFGHLPAFNRTFAELDLPVRWSEEEYGRLLRIGGGKERLGSLLTADFIERARLPEDRAAQLEAVARWHRRKTEIYLGIVAEGRLPPRSGIRRLVAEALDAGWTLAVASTSAEPSVRAILESAVGPANAARFGLVLAGDVVGRKKPDPEIYHLALERLSADPADVLAIEDSRDGLLAAVGAGVRCLVTVNRYTEGADFGEAILVVSALGDPDGEETRVIANRGGARPGRYVALTDLAACLPRQRMPAGRGPGTEG